MTDAERAAALEAIAAEVRVCTRCRLHQGRTNAVPGEGNAATEVMFVGEGPGFNEDRQGRPFVGRAGDLLVRLLGSIGWRRDDVFITNVVKCRPPDNRDPQPDEIAACAPYLHRQLEVLDPAVVVTLGRYSLGTFMPGTRIGQVHGTARPIDPATGARDAVALAMYHPAAALRTPSVERESYQDVARVPTTLVESRRQRAERDKLAASEPALAAVGTTPVAAPAYDADSSRSAPVSMAHMDSGPNTVQPTLEAAESDESASSPTGSPTTTGPARPPMTVAAQASASTGEPPPDTSQMELF
jgi:uracil-DNA glycosylase